MNSPLPPQNHRVLLIDRDAAFHEQVRQMLGAVPARAVSDFASPPGALSDVLLPKDSGELSFELEAISQGDDASALVESAEAEGRPYSIAIVELTSVSNVDGVGTVTRLWKASPALQIVLCTALENLAWPDLAGRLGQTESLFVLKKPFEAVELRQLAQTLSCKWNAAQQRRLHLEALENLIAQRTAEMQNLEQDMRAMVAERARTDLTAEGAGRCLAQALKSSPVPFAIQSLRTGCFVDANEGFVQALECGRDELIGRTAQQVPFWVDSEQAAQLLQRVDAGEVIRNQPCQIKSRAGRVREVLLSAEMFNLGAEPHLLMVLVDVTERLELEAQLRHSLKMEAVGQLAAGFAHDLNNILTVLQGYTGLLLRESPPGSKSHKALSAIDGATKRGANLVKQLLAFSRKQPVQPRVITLDQVLTPMSEVLRRTIEANISLHFNLPAKMPALMADVDLLDQMLMNLVLNARDAMPEGGTLTISADTVELDAAAAAAMPEARAGFFVRLQVSDTGVGIPPEALPRVFEPFFTTKRSGKGTGLGLSAVHGVVKQHEGWMQVESTPGRGATFTAYLPACVPQPAVEDSNQPVEETTPAGSETVLIAEDDDDVREIMVNTLRQEGYRVLPAENGAHALDLCTKYDEQVDLLLTDVIMPGGISGGELARKLQARVPALKVIYTSGYAPGVAAADLNLVAGFNFLPKPHRPSELVRMVRECLDQGLSSDPEPTTLAA